MNKLISAYNEDNEDAPELTRAVREQCQAADGFILVVNASKLSEEGTQHYAHIYFNIEWVLDAPSPSTLGRIIGVI